MENQENPKKLTPEEVEQQKKNLKQKQEEQIPKEDDAVILFNINQEIAKKEENIQNTQNKINDIRNKLGLESSNEIPPSVQKEQDLINKLDQEKLDIDKESKCTADSSNENSEFSLIKENWRKAAEERFGIKDFNLETFKRIILKNEAVWQAFSDGKDWDYIYNNLDNFIESESYDQATKAFESMEELENEVPGSVKNLHEKSGIVNFQRYPKEILINQLTEIDKEKGVGFLAFAESDFNGAFDNQKEIWEKIYNNKKNDLNFRIVECGSNFDLARQFLKINKDTGKNISLAILSAHSEPEGFYLGEQDNNKAYVNKEKILEFQSKIKEIFTDDAQLVGNACSSGAIEGWIKDVSRLARIKAVGPDRPAAIEDVDFYNNEVIPKYYDNDIYSNYHKGFLLSKKSKKL